MKIAVCSDLHLEFGDLDFANDEGADVLVLSGDICVARDLSKYDVYGIMEGTRSSRLHDFFIRCSSRFPHVIYVAGNHEHYDGDFVTTYEKLKTNLAYLKNVYVLDREVKVIDDVMFIGGTMWTDMNNEDPLTLFHIKSVMNDFKTVTNSSRKVTRTVPLYKKGEDGKYLKDERGYYIQEGTKKKEEDSTFCPEDSVEDHRKFLDFVKVMTAEAADKKFVVCTHHTPSHRSCAPYYKDDAIMNGAYHSNLEDFILDRPAIKLWTHGHTHDDFDYLIGETRVVCNPRGYIKYEARAANFKLKVVEV
jgi:DNA repair exonuclease SbcCD nuclease subunit